MSELTVTKLINQDVQLCKAWVHFNGSGTVAIDASYNVSSITDNGTGNYTLNFATAMVDANYSWSGSALHTTTSIVGTHANALNDIISTTQLQTHTIHMTAGTSVDSANITLQVFGN